MMQGLSSMAAVKEPTRPVAPPEVDGWKVVSTKSLDVSPKKIFDYMDGAGEFYLAFQFMELHVWKYQRNGDTTITVEAYEMGSPTEAFGVLSQDLDGEDVKIGQESVYAAGLLRFWQGRWVFSILVELETPETRRVVLDLGRAFAAQVPPEGERPKLLSRLPREGLVAHSVHYFHKQVCLNSFYFFAVENLLQLNEKTDVVMAEYRFNKQPTDLLIVRYPDAAAAAKARTTFREKYLKGLTISPEPVQLAQIEGGEWVGLRLDGNHLIVAFRSRSRDICERLLKAVNLTNGGKQR
jgi:hypothetical protein